MRSRERTTWKNLHRWLSHPLCSLSLALAVGASGCGTPPLDPEQVAQQSEALFGATTYESSCHSADIPEIQLAFRYARIAAKSPAFEECIRRTFTQNMVLNQSNTYTDGPYIACAGDPPTPNADTIIASARTVNPTDIGCDYSKLGTSTGAYAGIGGVPANDPTSMERITMGSALGGFQNTTGPCYLGNGGACVSDSLLGDVGATIFHEAMHQHGYDHMEFSSPMYYCGIDPSRNPKYANSVPYMVEGCLQYTLEHSATFCPMHACGSGLNLQRSVFESTPDCACVADPMPSDPSLCLPPGLSCGGSNECCSGACASGKCQCAAVGNSCGSNSECCSHNCSGGACQCIPLGGSCDGAAAVCCGIGSVCNKGLCTIATGPNTCNGETKPTTKCSAAWHCCDEGWHCGVCS